MHPFRRRLSARQAEILDLLEQNLYRKEIASALGISESMVGKHVSRLLRKAGCESTREMIFAGLIQIRQSDPSRTDVFTATR